MDMQFLKICSPFLNQEGKVKQLPVKGAKKQAVLQYLAAKFETEKNYREKEVNLVLQQWHTFDDFYLLRRELVDNGFLGRLADGSQYWVEK